MTRDSRNRQIVRGQEILALRLLDRASAKTEDMGEVPIDVQLDVFEKVGKWVSIKNRLEETEETDIDRFKRRIAGETPVVKSREPRPDTSRIDQIKSRLPDRGHSGADGDRGDPGVEVPVTVGGSRGFSVGLPGDSKP